MLRPHVSFLSRSSDGNQALVFLPSPENHDVNSCWSGYVFQTPGMESLCSCLSSYFFEMIFCTTTLISWQSHLLFSLYVLDSVDTGAPVPKALLRGSSSSTPSPNAHVFPLHSWLRTLQDFPDIFSPTISPVPTRQRSPYYFPFQRSLDLSNKKSMCLTFFFSSGRF